MNFRTATSDDVPRVLPMVRKIAAYHEKLDPLKYPYKPDTWQRYGPWLSARADDPRSVFLVAEAQAGAGDAKLAAFLVGTVEKEIPIYRLDEYGFIHDLWVEEEYRHEGVARQLVMLAIERFGQIGVKQVRLDVLYENSPARALFLACGMRPTVVEMVIAL